MFTRAALAVGFVALLLGIVLTTFTHAPGQAAPPAPRAFVHPDVYKALRDQGEASFIVYLREQPDLSSLRTQVRGMDRVERRRRTVQLLQSIADRTQAPLLAFLTQNGLQEHVRDIQRLWIINALVITGDAKALELLSRHPAVLRIVPNRERQLPPSTMGRIRVDAWHLRLIEAARVHRELDITGRGIVVANIDTGVEWTLPALRASYRGRDGDHNYNWFDPTGTFPEAPGDDHGHGTATMSLIAARGGDVALGVAPGVEWIAVKVFDARGRTRDALLHQAFQWILAPTDLSGKNPDPSRAPDIVSNSWGAPNGADATFLPDIEALRTAGIIPVFAAGNSGKQGEGTINTPAAFPNVIAAGATDANDRLADFSSRGPTPDQRLKPDLTAPGVNVLVQDNDGDYATASGTSFSTPIVAGVIALMLEANPNLDYDAIYNLLTRTAQDLGVPGPDMEFGWGRVNAYAAVQGAFQAAALRGRVLTPDGTPVPHAVLQGLHTGDPTLRFTTKTDSTGRYRLSVPAGTYTLNVRAFGFEPVTLGPLSLPPNLDTLYDVTLAPLPTYPVTVTVIDATGPITDATLQLAGTSITLTGTNTLTGLYTFQAPAGVYTLTVTTPRHRAAQQQLTVPMTQPITVTLTPAPRLLVVNGDAWVGDDIRFYYRRLLNEAGLPFAWLDITDAASLPTLATLQEYDAVIWAHPLGAPGWYIQVMEMDVWPILAQYIQQGGRVLLTGPDIGYWEADYNVAGNNGQPLVELFGARYQEDESGAQFVAGTPEEIVENITLELNHVLAYKNQSETDVLEPVSTARLIQQYITSPPQGAGVRYTPASGRTIYLGYGLEGVDYRAGAQALRRMIDWLTQPELRVQATPSQIRLDDTVLVTVTVRNPTTLFWEEVTLSIEAVPELLPSGVTRWQLNLSPRGTENITTTYRLATPVHGNTPLTLTVRLQLPDSTRREITYTLSAIAPDLRPSTADIPAALLPDVTYTATFTVTNLGSVTATTALTMSIPPPLVITPTTSTLSLSADGRELYWQGILPPAQQGRPEYTVRTSRDPDGPPFAWIDPPHMTELELGDDEVQGPFSLPFAFPFFGKRYNELWISSNGWVALAPPARSYPINLRLPNPNAPAALIAPFWDDLNPRKGGTVKWYSDTTRVVVTWDQVLRYGSGGPYTFQLVLYRDGTIAFQYLDMQPPLNRATVGLQNEARDEAIVLAYDEPFVEDALAVLIEPPFLQRPGQTALPFLMGVHQPLPDNTPLPVAVRLRATGAPEVTRVFTAVVKPADFSQTTLVIPESWPTGRQTSLSLIVQNTGVGAGHVAVAVRLSPGLQFITAPEGDLFSTGFVWQDTVAPNEALTLPLTVYVDETLPAYHPLTVTLTVKDNIHPPRTQTFTALTARPQLVADWDLSSDRVVTGDRITSTLYLWNTGNFTATVTLTQTLPPGLEPITDALPAGVTYDPGTRVLQWENTLRPAQADYTWEDNRSTPLPFIWLEPTNAITVLHNVDDVTKGPLPLGFPMPFYDTVQSYLFVNSNGWVSFTDGERRDFTNRELPTTAAPRNLLAVWWDDLRVPLTGTVRFWSDHQRAVVTWNNVFKFGRTRPYTFQVQLDATGVITYLYKTMEGALNSATIGLQDATGTRGVTVVHNDESYMEDGRVIRFTPPFALSILQYPLQVSDQAPPVLTSTLRIADPIAGTRTFTRTLRVNVADLSSSFATLSAPAITRGETVTLTLFLRNTGNYTGTTAPVLILPPELTVVATDGMVQGNEIRWERTVGPGQTETAVAVLALRASLGDGAQISIQVGDPQWWHRELTLTVRAADIRASRVEASTAFARPQTPITIELHLVNTGSAATGVEWEMPLPDVVEVFTETLRASAGSPPTYDPQRHRLQWSGNLPARAQRLFFVEVRAPALTRWRPRVQIITPEVQLTVRGPRLRWGWIGLLPRLHVR